MENARLFKVYMPAGVDLKLKEILNSGYVAEGEAVRKFEKLLGEFGQNSNVVATNSCTSALHLALAMVTKNDPGYVLTTPVTCVATNVSVVNLKNTIIWTDVDPQSGMITKETFLNTWGKLTPEERKKVKALIFVMWGGDAGDLANVYEATQEVGIPLIVDAAQGFGAKINGEPVPKLYGDYLVYSFQAIKHITTGDGGCLFVRNPENLKRAAVLKWFGIDRDMFRTPTGEINWQADIPEIGYKFHMNNITATIGIAQMEDNLRQRLDEYTANAQDFDYLFKCLGAEPGYHSFQRSANTENSANWVYTAVTSANVDQLIPKLKTDYNIDSSQMHIRNDIYSGFNGICVTPLDGVTKFEKEHICIPCGFWITNEEREYIFLSVAKCLER